jgi:hypothetical protein
MNANTPQQPLAPEVLLHYTDGRGLLGIVENHVLWASRAQFLNDHRELRHAFDLARSLLAGPQFRDYAGAQIWDEHLATSDPISHVYVASLTANGDDLSQWRAYGRTGDSYAVGLSGAALAVEAARHGWRLLPCLYELAEQNRRVCAILERWLKWFEDDAVPSYDSDPDPKSRLVRYGTGDLLHLAPTFKHSAFEAEHEWRLISGFSDKLQVRHRAGKGALIPYKEFPLPTKNGALTSPKVVIGPGSPDQSAAVQGLHSLLVYQNISGWEMDISKAPYRGW